MSCLTKLKLLFLSGGQPGIWTPVACGAAAAAVLVLAVAVAAYFIFKKKIWKTKNKKGNFFLAVSYYEIP